MKENNYVKRSAATKNRAFAEFLKGASLRVISEQDGMPSKRTLEKWSTRGGWQAAREQAHAEARSKAITSRTRLLEDEYTSLEAKRHGIAIKAIAQLTALVDGDLRESELALSKSELLRLVDRLTR